MSSLGLSLSALVALAGCGALTSIVPGAGSSSQRSQPSQPSTVAEREAAKAAEPKTPFDLICARASEEIGPKHDDKADDTSLFGRRMVWRPVLLGAKRAQFVTTTKPKKVHYTLSDSERVPPHEIRAGEPLLVTSCTTYGGSWVRVLTIDGIYETSYAADELVLDPPAFTLPEETAAPQPADLPPSKIVGQAHPDDRAAVPGLNALQTKYYDCATLATGQCMAAEKRVAEGPWRADLAAAKRKACDAAADKEWAKCMTNAERKQHAAGAKKVGELTRARDAAFATEMRRKLQ